MNIQNIQYVTKSSDYVYRIKNNEIWNGYFILLGEATIDVKITCVLEEHTDASIYVVSVPSGASLFTVRTMQHHIAKNSRSNVLVKNVGSDMSSFVFDGSIVVDRIADKTDAYQRNENLLLSPDAKVVSRPTLEILASDVRCTHAATTGEIPFDELWYLKTRGLSDTEAKMVYVQGFIRSALVGLKQDVSETILHRIMNV
jgi:Fe-S cluster assembly scaffold protein SufB